MRRSSLASALPLVILVLGCGSHSPTAPPASSTVTGVTITGVDAILTGLSTFYTVTAALGDGTSRTVTPIWSSSNPDVATVDITGRLEARAHGLIISAPGIEVGNRFDGNASWTIPVALIENCRRASDCSPRCSPARTAACHRATAPCRTTTASAGRRSSSASPSRTRKNRSSFF